MKANELRVGNWVSKQGMPYQSTSATIAVLEYDLGLINPIPLTADWLIKLGFKKVGNREEYVVFGMRVCKTTDNEFVCPDYDDRDITLHYVHQLQNFYHAITGKELNA